MSERQKVKFRGEGLLGQDLHCAAGKVNEAHPLKVLNAWGSGLRM